MELAYQLVIFDFDGTLVDSNAIKRDCFRRTGEKFEFAPEDILSVVDNNPGYTRKEVFSEITSGRDNTDDMFLQLMAYYEELTTKQVVEAKIKRGVDTVFEFLRTNRINYYLSSATPYINLREILDKRGDLFGFSGVYGSPESKVEHIFDICQISNIDVREALYVGDSLIDSKSANEAGCAFVGVGDHWKSHYPPQPHINDLSDFVDYFTGNSPSE